MYIKQRRCLRSLLLKMHASLNIEKLEAFLVAETFHRLLPAECSFITTQALIVTFRSTSFTDLIRAEGNSSSVAISQSTTTFITGPYLDGNGISNVTTQISTHAYLPCKVSRIGDSFRDGMSQHFLTRSVIDYFRSNSILIGKVIPPLDGINKPSLL